MRKSTLGFPTNTMSGVPGASNADFNCFPSVAILDHSSSVRKIHSRKHRRGIKIAHLLHAEMNNSWNSFSIAPTNTIFQTLFHKAVELNNSSHTLS